MSLFVRGGVPLRMAVKTFATKKPKGMKPKAPIGAAVYVEWFHLVDKFGKYRVSTVNVADSGFFETMVFGNNFFFDASGNETAPDEVLLRNSRMSSGLSGAADYQKRHTSWEDAVADHRRVCSWLRHAGEGVSENGHKPLYTNESGGFTSSDSEGNTSCGTSSGTSSDTSEGTSEGTSSDTSDGTSSGTSSSSSSESDSENDLSDIEAGGLLAAEDNTPIGNTKLELFSQIVDTIGDYQISTVNALGSGFYQTLIIKDPATGCPRVHQPAPKEDSKNISQNGSQNGSQSNTTEGAKDASKKASSILDLQNHKFILTVRGADRYISWEDALRGHQLACRRFYRAKELGFI